MIQRIQTLYLGIALVLLSIVSIGTSIFHYANESSRFVFNSWGITEYELTKDTVLSTGSFPFFIVTIFLALLCFLCLMSYKKLTTQKKLGSLLAASYFLAVIAVIAIQFYGSSMFGVEAEESGFGMGYYLFIIGFPFTILANIGIRRDKRLLDSLDRLR